jgi:hypothetical protein
MATITDLHQRNAARSPTAPRHVSTVPQSRVLQGRLPLPAVLYLLSVVIPIMFNVGPLLLSGLRLYLLLLILPLMVRLFSGHFGRVSVIDILFILHIGWATLALAMNNPDKVVSQIGSVGMEFLGGYLVGRAYIRTSEEFAALCRWVISLVLCTLLFAIVETQTDNPVIIETIRKIPGFLSVENINYEPRLGLKRAQVVFAHPIHYGLFCSVAFSLAFVALKDQTLPAKRYVISGLVMLSGFLSLSSGALLAIFLQLFLILWASLFDKIRWRWWLLLGLGCASYVIIDLISNRPPVTAVLSRMAFSTHNLYIRTIIFEWGMKNVWDNPILGIGLNEWVRPSYMTSGSIDNFWLVIVIRYGIPGFLLLVTGYVIGLFRVMGRNFDTDPVLLHFRRAWVFTFLGLSFTLSTVHIWTNIYSFVFFMFGAGMWLISVAPRSSETSDYKAGHEEQKRSFPYTRFSKHQMTRSARQLDPERTT